MSPVVRELRVHSTSLALVRPFVTAIRRADSIPVVLVEAVDEEGTSGWGEAAASWRVTGESPESVRSAVEGPIAEVVIGRSLDGLDHLDLDLSRALVQNSAARSAVECAVLDLAATRAGRTLAGTMGATRDGVLTDVTVSAGSTDSLVNDAVRWAEAGFGTIKLKVGAGGDDRSALPAVREAVGPQVRLRADANQGWGVDEAVGIIRHWEDAGVDLELVEQPVRARDLDGMAAVTARVATPVLADESVRTSEDLDELIRRSAADLVNLKLAKSAGPARARRMARRAAEHGLGVVIGCMMESAVGVGAAAALAASLPGPDGERTHDLDAGLWQSTAPVRGGIRYRGPRIVFSDRPGLGIDGLAGRGSPSRSEVPA
ncbi:mandelate racemase/muconate lactonizing enzyme family protein [Actinotalea sp.]|uniref:mandelate racemase/muconate lactonizing enzyme family protein n=1 Tax=Actinotalea sp. TaxID=1872145 RepID=UPI00356AAFA6